MPAARILPAGDAALLVACAQVIDPAVNAWCASFATEVQRRLGAAARDVVVGYCGVTVYFDPLLVDAQWLEGELATIAGEVGEGEPSTGTLVEVPVAYGGEFGPDLEEVARFARCPADEVVARHAATVYHVYMIGFVPGFAYMARVDPRIAAPRRPEPRAAVPAGSVAIAGGQTGIYPDVTPGGWNIIGRTPVQPFDPRRPQPSLVKPGDAVRFLPIDAHDFGRLSSSVPAAGWRESSSVTAGDARRALAVIRPGLLTTVQDLGRWGHQALGIPVAGPMDPYSHRLANRMIGNVETAAALEVTLQGPELEAHDAVTCAVAGAHFELTVDGHPAPMEIPFDVPAGARIRFGRRTGGARAALAVAGGFDVEPLYDSRATSLVSRMGPFGGRALRAGDVLPIGEHPPGRPRRSGRGVLLPAGGARLRVIAGPHADMFTPDAMRLLSTARFVVTSSSNRMGYRLEGPTLEHAAGADILSEATPIGSIQVPGSGQPILLMADRQTTGGYPRIATLIAADLPAAAQLAPGDWIEFTPVTRPQALDALRRQQARLEGRA